MSNTASICWKEVRSIFAPPGAYALIVFAGLWFVLGAFGPSQLSEPIFGLTGFAPQGVLRLRQVALEIGFVRVAALVLLPMISMRLFLEEKRNRVCLPFFKHEGSAGWATLLVSMALLRWDAVAMLDGWNIALCAGLVAAGWVLTWRSIRSLREGFCG